MIRISLFLFFCAIALNFQAQSIGGIDPTTLTNSDIKKLGFGGTDIQSLKSEFKAPTDNKVKPKVTDTIQDVEDVSKKVPEPTDSAILAQQELNSYKTTYGKSFFQNENLKIFKSASHVKAADDYILGTGDELTIAIWGYAEASLSERISDDGAIHPNLVGKIYLSGLTLAEARKVIKAKYGAVYDLKNSQISIEIKFAKTIMVNIVGEVAVPGTYSVSAVNSAFNVLSLAGGLTDLASVRNIVIKRDNKVFKVLDVYKFLQDPAVVNDFYLKNNDYIIVQPAAKLVFVKGEVGRTGKYELTKNEGLADVIKFAGGLGSQAFTEKASVIRVDTNHLVVKDLNLKAALEGKLVALKNGDTVLISEVNSALRNYVEVSGAVQLAGRFQHIKGEKVSHLLARAQGLRFDAYMGRAYVIRSYQGGERKYFQINLNEIEKDSNSADNIVLEDLDKIRVFSALDFFDPYTVEIRGAVRREGKLEYSDNLTLQDVIFFFGGLKNEAANNRIEISRWVNYIEVKDNSAPIEVIVETYDVSDDLSLNMLKEVKLRPMDKIFVRYVQDYQTQPIVVLRGQIKYPGTYALLNTKETIKDVIERAGGLNEGAFLEGAKMYRSMDERGELVVNFHELFVKGKEQYNYVLRHGDTITVPKIDDIIAIRGEVGSVSVAEREVQNAPFTKGKRARYYISEYAGGFTKEASRSKVYVISSSGSVKKSRNFGLFKIYPRVKRGDKITVARKKQKEEIETVPLDWNKTIEALTVKVTGVMTLYLLFKNVFK